MRTYTVAEGVEDAPRQVASGFRSYTVERAVRPKNREAKPPYEVERFTVMAPSGGQAGRLADESKYQREVERGYHRD